MFPTEFEKSSNPFFLFRKSLQLAMNECEGCNIDAAKLSTIASHQWGKLPPSVRRGWQHQANENKTSRQSAKGSQRDGRQRVFRTDSDNEDSDREVSSEEGGEWKNKGTPRSSFPWFKHLFDL